MWGLWIILLKLTSAKYGIEIDSSDGWQFCDYVKPIKLYMLNEWIMLYELYLKGIVGIKLSNYIGIKYCLILTRSIGNMTECLTYLSYINMSKYYAIVG